MSDWRDRPVLVTGAMGLLGGWLVEALLAREAAVVCVVRDRVPRSSFVAESVDRRGVYVTGDFGHDQRGRYASKTPKLVPRSVAIVHQNANAAYASGDSDRAETAIMTMVPIPVAVRPTPTVRAPQVNRPCLPGGAVTFEASG